MGAVLWSMVLHAVLDTAQPLQPLQLWEVGTPFTQMLEATTWSNKAATYEEGKVEPCTY